METLIGAIKELKEEIKEYKQALELAAEEEKLEFKVGDWVLLEADGNGLAKDSIVQLMEIDKSKKPSGHLANSSPSMFMFKNPTGSEYFKTREESIIRLATEEEIKIAFNVAPVIEINGYKAKFYKDVVSFGCQDVKIETIKQINRLQRQLDVDLTKEADNIAAIVKYYNTNKVTQEKDDLPF